MMSVHVPHWVYRRLRKEEKQIDAATLVVGLIGPIATIPQILQIYHAHSATSISLLSWVLYLIATIISLVYSVVHKLKPLFWSNVCWFIVTAIVIAQIFIYK